MSSILSVKGKWQQKFFSKKEIQKQYIELYQKFFITFLLGKTFSPNSTNYPPSWINFYPD